MKLDHFHRYLADRFELVATEMQGPDEVIRGELRVRSTGTSHPIRNGLPRFVGGENYADNFGLQWNKFRATQLDSHSGLKITHDRFWKNTGWKAEELRGKTVLEVGSGAGRFTEVLLAAGAEVVSFDYSSAVDANWKSNEGKGDLFLFQGDLHQIPFPDGYFDYVFCYGVLQHTPAPEEAYRSILSKLKPGGKLSIDWYLKLPIPTAWSTPKYFWRPITRRMKPEHLLKVVQTYIPWYLPLDTAVRRIPKVGTVLLGLVPIPCWNHLRLGLNQQQRLEWAIMDTFDALGAAYDSPKSLRQVRDLVRSAPHGDMHVFYGSHGVVANVTLPRPSQTELSIDYASLQTTVAA